MKKIILVTSASILSAVSATSAVAADSWTGPYAGLSVGYQDGQVKGASGGDLDYYGISNPNTSTPIGGIFGGYNYQILQTSFFTGVEASFDVGGEKQTQAGSNFPAADPQSSAKVPYDIALKAKLGYAFDKLLPYVEAGVAGARTELKATASDGTDLGSKKFAPGWVAGVGVDYAFRDNLFLRANYSYTSLKNEDYLNDANEFDHRFILNAFKIGIAYKF